MGHSDRKARQPVVTPEVKPRKLGEPGDPQRPGLLESLRPILNHDLPNMLVVLNGFLQMLRLEEEARLSATGRDYLQRLEGITQKLQQTIAALRQISKVSSSAMIAETIALPEFLKEVSAAAKKLLPDQRLVIHSALQVGNVTVPRALLQQALLEGMRLLACGVTGPELHCRFTAQQTRHGIELALGMPPSNGSSAATRESGGCAPSAPANVSVADAVDYNLFGPDQRLGLVLIEEIVRTWGGRLGACASVEQGKWLSMSVPERPGGGTPTQTSHPDKRMDP